MIKKETLPARANSKARILVKADKGPHGDGWTDRAICQSLETSPSTVARVRETFVMEGLDAVFARKQRPHPAIKRIFDGEAEAKLIALACSQPPEGHSRWTIRLLADKVVEMNIVEAAHFNTIGRTLKKNELKPHRSRYWVIPPKQNAAFVADMENVLAIYQRPRDPKLSLVCLDEAAKQLVSATRLPISITPGHIVAGTAAGESQKRISRMVEGDQLAVDLPDPDIHVVDCRQCLFGHEGRGLGVGGNRALLQGDDPVRIGGGIIDLVQHDHDGLPVGVGK